ncbi:hypothetical protein CDAR_446441 [Caerostris darwini]|uniref:Uncharacterized protein n=1 Tax=Caerostris darwini TaxID=1538125 RepID=A0AAV4SVN6_9ARAC|nr:hypothetical protein CDAR_446441 [Caerostris darwini]
MEQATLGHHLFKLSQAIQFCGYLAATTNFGKIKMLDEELNPWIPAEDLYTIKSCANTKLEPGINYPPFIKFVDKTPACEEQIRCFADNEKHSTAMSDYYLPQILRKYLILLG